MVYKRYLRSNVIYVLTASVRLLQHPDSFRAKFPASVREWSRMRQSERLSSVRLRGHERRGGCGAGRNNLFILVILNKLYKL